VNDVWEEITLSQVKELLAEAEEILREMRGRFSRGSWREAVASIPAAGLVTAADRG
jgi:hypothetical protein